MLPGEKKPSPTDNFLILNVPAPGGEVVKPQTGRKIQHPAVISAGFLFSRTGKPKENFLGVKPQPATLFLPQIPGRAMLFG